MAKTKTTKPTTTTTTPTPAQARAAKLEAAKLALAAPSKPTAEQRDIEAITALLVAENEGEPLPPFKRIAALKYRGSKAVTATFEDGGTRFFHLPIPAPAAKLWQRVHDVPAKGAVAHKARAAYPAAMPKGDAKPLGTMTDVKRLPSLTTREAIVLGALKKSAAGNGNDFAFVEDVLKDAGLKLTGKQVGALLTTLQGKGVVTVHDPVTTDSGTFTQVTSDQWGSKKPYAPTYNDAAAVKKSGDPTVDALRNPKRIAAALTVEAAEKRATAKKERVKPEPTDDGRCPKCGRFNEVGYPNCLNDKACATRIETAQNYNTYVLGKK